ncbi:unnamed protein product [Echinostoma caproni]|uniref:ADP-ribosylation factor GTPase-activating protein 2-like n=1 Tax=Echinostoma caproni TaxID=27848 RepID=A0A183APM5_9TREM|nr:unnamed protein product [Echinostoma caproni]
MIRCFVDHPFEEPKVGPVVDLNSGTGNDVSKSTVSVRPGTRKSKPGKVSAKKGGLGAAKVKADFTAIESAAENADLQRERQAMMAKQLEKEEMEKEAERIASLRLAYKDVAEEREKKEQALKAVDPKRAEQVERLGMGTGTRGISHSAFSDVRKIEQEGTNTANSTTRSSALVSSKLDPFFDSSPGLGTNGRIGSTRRLDSDDPFSRGGSGWIDETPKGDGWTREVDPFDSYSTRSNVTTTGTSNKTREPTVTSSDWGRSSPRDSRKQKTLSSEPISSTQSEELRTKFANVSSISSDAFFGREEVEDAGFSRFHGSESISSDDYFGRAKPQPPSQLSNELQQIKDGVRQGVTKVATRLSHFASDMVSTLQVCASP